MSSDNNLENKVKLEKCGVSSLRPGDLVYWDGIGFEVEEVKQEGRCVRVYINGRWQVFSDWKIVFVIRKEFK